LLLIIPALLAWYARSLVRNVYDDYGERNADACSLPPVAPNAASRN
jgi:hypothetical protein